MTVPYASSPSNPTITPIRYNARPVIVISTAVRERDSQYCRLQMPVLLFHISDILDLFCESALMLYSLSYRYGLSRTHDSVHQR
mmetsp:Transcript_2990/g.5505  ORF Transcript_2990/g.5505 Transcript_2990/m.5505 type:complete len:84 (+) Transcript_2990:83-334(+)